MEGCGGYKAMSFNLWGLGGYEPMVFKCRDEEDTRLWLLKLLEMLVQNK